MRFYAVFGLWGLFVLVWVVSAFFAQKTVKKESAFSRLRYGLIAGCAGVVLQPGLLRLPALDVHYTDSDAGGALAVALIAMGIGFAFGSAYSDYAKRVKRLIPFVW